MAKNELMTVKDLMDDHQGTIKVGVEVYLKRTNQTLYIRNDGTVQLNRKQKKAKSEQVRETIFLLKGGNKP